MLGELRNFTFTKTRDFPSQGLVSDNLIGPTQPVFQFLCPLDKLLSEEEHYGGVWSLLSGLAYFLTPGQEEEEVKTSTYPLFFKLTS